MTYDQELAAKGKMRTQKVEMIQLNDGRLAPVYREVVVKIPKAAKSVAPKAKRTRTSKGTTKLDLARKIYQVAVDSKSRDEIIQMFMFELGMSKAGATTYFYNVKK